MEVVRGWVCIFSGIAHTGFNFSSWNTLVIDGHDVEAVCKAFYEAKTTKGRPTAILAKTYKGKGVEGMVIGHMH